jgi:alpha-N-acetylglucosamine transferase
MSFLKLKRRGQKKKSLRINVNSFLPILAVTVMTICFAFTSTIHLSSDRETSRLISEFNNVKSLKKQIETDGQLKSDPILSTSKAVADTKKVNTTVVNTAVADVSVANTAIPTISQVTDSNEKKQRFAYVFLVAGCKPESPSYKAYIYNIAIAKYLLNRYNSTSDVVAMIRMHTDTSYDALRPEDEAILKKLGVIIKYIPKPLTDNFHTAMMDKFRILELTEYERVLYLDSDVIPLNNLDYMFEKSTGPNATLEENVVIAYKMEPSSGGFFMLKPNKDDYLEVTKIIERVEKLGYHFNETTGWGHEITAPDYWQSFHQIGRKWDFYGSFTDQGLLYHWTKYVKKKVSIVIGRDSVQMWNADENDNAKMVRKQKQSDIFGDVQKYGKVSSNEMRAFPYTDFKHFTSRTKPWLKKVAKNPPPKYEDINFITKPLHLWYHVLRELNNEHNLGIDTEHLSFRQPSLGLFPTNSMVMLANNAREKQRG